MRLGGCFLRHAKSNQGLNVGMDLAVDTGIFDYGNVGYMSSLPALTPADLKGRGSVPWPKPGSHSLDRERERAREREREKREREIESRTGCKSRACKCSSRSREHNFTVRLVL